MTTRATLPRFARRWILALRISIPLKFTAGAAEEFVAAALAGRDRSQLFITSKAYPTHFSYDQLIAAAKQSLERLQLKQLDLYLLHGPNSAANIAQTMAAMDFLLEHELVRFIGVSNFSAAELQAAQRCTRYPIVNNQVHYALNARLLEQDGTLAYCQAHNILVTAYRPLGKGELLNPAHPLLLQLAEKYQKTPAQIALNWVIAQPNVVTLVKASNPAHLQEDLGALGWELSALDLALLHEQFPRGETIWGPRR